MTDSSPHRRGLDGRLAGADGVTATDELLREVEALRPVIDAATRKTGVQIRGVIEHGTIKVTASVKPIEVRG